MSTIKEYIGKYSEMWVTDQRAPQAKSKPRQSCTGSSIYEHIKCKTREIAGETTALLQKENYAAGLREQAAKLTNRRDIRRRRSLTKEADELERHIAEAKEGQRQKDFESTVAPFVEAHQKQLFCRKRKIEEILPASSEGQDNSVLDEYLACVERSPPKFIIEQKDICAECKGNVKLYSSLSMLVCVECGYSVPFLDATAALLAYTDDSYDYCSFSYKRINHFNEWIQQFQAKETTEIPDAVLTAIMQRLQDERVTEMKDVTTTRVRDILKKLKLRRWYEHSVAICCRLTGEPPPRMSPEQEEQCRLMFLAIQNSFEKHCPADRKNFLSYSYVLFKFCQLLGYTEFLNCFNLLKGRDKLMKQDAIFEAICKDLDWEFIPSSGTP